MAKINASNVYKLASFTVVGGAFAGTVSYGVLKQMGFEPDYLLTVTTVEALVHTPILMEAAKSLRYELGERKPMTISGANFAQNARKIPVTSQNSVGHIFAHSIPALRQKADFEPDRLEAWVISDRGNEHTLVYPEVEGVYRVAWKRQRGGLAPLSRNHFVTNRRIHRVRYEAMIALFVSAGLVLDRGGGRSGQLWLPPLAAMDQLARVM